jgi:hypothetical protein
MRPENYDILFMQTEKTLQAVLKKPLVNINAMLDFAIAKNEDLLLINSDIIISKLPEFNSDGVTMFSRYDYLHDQNESKKFENGFDAFFIPKHFLKVFPPSMYCLGAAWHDYAMPLNCIQRKIPLYYPDSPLLFHKWHETRYSFEEWTRVGKYFKWELGWDENMTIPEIATAALKTINENLIKI